MLTNNQIKHRTVGSLRVVKILRDHGEKLDRDSLNKFASNEIKDWSFVHCLQWLSGQKALKCLSEMMENPDEIRKAVNMSGLAALDLLHLASRICRELRLTGGLNVERISEVIEGAHGGVIDQTGC